MSNSLPDAELDRVIQLDPLTQRLPELPEVKAMARELKALREQCERQRKALEAARLQHLVCDDSWYSCPLSKEGCANEYDSGCTCGAEKHNAAIDAALGLPSSASDKL